MFPIKNQTLKVIVSDTRLSINCRNLINLITFLMLIQSALQTTT